MKVGKGVFRDTKVLFELKVSTLAHQGKKTKEGIAHNLIAMSGQKEADKWLCFDIVFAVLRLAAPTQCHSLVQKHAKSACSFFVWVQTDVYEKRAECRWGHCSQELLTGSAFWIGLLDSGSTAGELEKAMCLHCS